MFETSLTPTLEKIYRIFTKMLSHESESVRGIVVSVVRRMSEVTLRRGSRAVL